MRVKEWAVLWNRPSEQSSESKQREPESGMAKALSCTYVSEGKNKNVDRTK